MYHNHLLKFINIPLVLFLTALLLVGCWDRVELNDLGLVLAAGIDKADNDRIKLSLQFAVPGAMGIQSSVGGGQEGKNPTVVESATGKTIVEAMSLLQAKFSRRIFWGQSQVVIIGKDLAQTDDIKKHIDFFARYPKARIRANVFVADGQAIDILKVVPVVDRSSSEVARELANFNIGMQVTVKDLIESLSDEQKVADLPVIETNKEGGLILNGTAVLKNGQMIGQLNERLTRGLLWLKDEMGISTITVKPKGYNNEITFNILRSRTHLIPKINNGKWKILLKIAIEDDMSENETPINPLEPSLIKDIEKQLSDTIEHRIYQTLEVVQKEMKTDIIDFGKTFNRHYPDEWEKVKDRWDQKFPEIEVEIESNVNIKRPGMISTQ